MRMYQHRQLLRCSSRTFLSSTSYDILFLSCRSGGGGRLRRLSGRALAAPPRRQSRSSSPADFDGPSSSCSIAAVRPAAAGEREKKSHPRPLPTSLCRRLAHIPAACGVGTHA